MYEFIMCLHPEFEKSHAQLLHSPTAYTLDEAFALLLAEETRLQASSTSVSTALAAQRFAPPAAMMSSAFCPATASESSRPLSQPKKNVTC